MGKNKVVLMPTTEKILKQMGEQISLARLRRDISVELAAGSVHASNLIIFYKNK